MSTTKSTPDHIAIIPDGNRRWARAQGIGSEKKIYEQGNQKTFEIIKASFEADIPFVTFWASSYANLLARPKPLVSAIEAVYATSFRDLAEDKHIHDNEVRVNIYGEWRDILKPDTCEALQAAIDATSHYDKRQLTVLVGYDGQRERGAAAQSLATNPASLKRLSESDLVESASIFREHSWTGHLPDVDLMIRTGAWQDPHNSAGFLSLISSESQYSYPEVLWPDFTADMLNSILADFTGRERRMGR